MTNIRDAGFGIFADDYAGSDVRSAVIRAVLAHWNHGNVDRIARDDVLMHRAIRHDNPWNTGRHAVEDPFKRVLFRGLKGDQGLGARVVDTTHHRKRRSFVLEYDGRPGYRRALSQGLRHLEFGRNGAIHFDKLASLSRIEKCSEILVRQATLPWLRGLLPLSVLLSRPSLHQTGIQSEQVQHAPYGMIHDIAHRLGACVERRYWREDDRAILGCCCHAANMTGMKRCLAEQQHKPAPFLQADIGGSS